MSTTENVSADHSGATGRAADDPGPSVWPSRAGGALLVAAPVLLAGGIATSPPQRSNSSVDYVASLAANPVISGISAALLHYYWVALLFGALAAIGLVRGRKGRGIATVGGIATAFGSIQISGLLLSDHFLASLGNRVPLDVAAGVFENLDAGIPWVAIWLTTGQVFGLASPVVLIVGLARAGVVGWWTVPVWALAWILPFALSGVVGGGVLGTVVAIASTLLLGTPLVLIGLRLIRRTAPDVRAAAQVA